MNGDIMAGVVEYQVIRPDGTVLYRECVASQADTLPDRPPEASLRVGPDAWIDPPYLIQRREYGPEWVTIIDRPGEPG